MTKYEQRINDLEQLGMNTSDAQGVLDAELMQVARHVSNRFGMNYEIMLRTIEDFYHDRDSKPNLGDSVPF